MEEDGKKDSQLDISYTQVKPKRRDRSASEERLINAGKEVFSKFGFDGATTKMISKTADVNESLIGRYFDGKEGLLVAIIQKFVEDLSDREIAYPPQNSLTEELLCYVNDRMCYGTDHSDFAKIIFSQALVNKEFRRRVRETIPMQMDPNLIKRVQLLADTGKLKNKNSVQTICRDIDIYLDGLFFFEFILHESKPESIIKQASEFIKNYAPIFEK